MPRDPGPRRLFETVAPWCEKAFTEYAADLNCRWELTLCTLPNPKTGGLISQLMLYIEAPIRNGMQWLADISIIAPGADEQWMTNTIRDSTTSLRARLDAIGDGFAEDPVDPAEIARATNGSS